MGRGIITKARERVKPERKAFIRKNLLIAQQIHVLLEKNGWSQKTFAKKLNKQESEVSKWLSGFHNITMKSLTLMETILGEEILTTPLVACEKYKSIKYVTLKAARPNRPADFQFSDTNVSYKKSSKIKVA